VKVDVVFKGVDGWDYLRISGLVIIDRETLGRIPADWLVAEKWLEGGLVRI